MYHTARILLRNRFSESVQQCCRSISTAQLLKLSSGNPESAAPYSVIPQGVLGQPTCHTHPHIVQYDHVANGLTQSEFVERRSELVKRLCQLVAPQKIPQRQIVIIPSASKQYMTEKIPYVFRQNSNFYYLTGCLEQDSVLVMTIDTDKIGRFKSTLFLRGPDKHSEQWDGPRTTFVDGKKMFAVDVALPFTEFNTFVKSHMSQGSSDNIVWFSTDNTTTELHQKISSILNQHRPFSIGCPKRSLHSMRLIKSPAERALMRRACAIASEAINKAMACTKPGISEHDIFALVDYKCRLRGAEQLAFPPVVAGGMRATAIHYINNNQILSSGEMILIDSGCQLSCYNSDISRTWPVSGKFNQHQLILYEIILELQLNLIKILTEKRPSLDHLFDTMCSLLGKSLKREGIISKDTTDTRATALAYKLCPHHVSHYLGLDVHDSSLISRDIPIENGMVVTVEPGIYIREDDISVRQEFRGIGIRIEDDALITEDDPEILTSSCYKQVKDIESTIGTCDLP